MTVDIAPVLLQLGPLAVRWYGVLALAGLALATWLSLRALARQRLGTRQPLDALAWALPVGIVAARLAYVTGYWDYYLTDSADLWRLNIDGLSLWGGLLGGLAVASARLRGDPDKRRRIFDVVAPYLAFGIALGNIGAFLDGHGQGLPAQLPWATQYVNHLAATPDFGVLRHPVQLYYAVIAALLGVVLLALPRSFPVGTRLAAFLIVYGIASVALGPLSLEPTFLFGLQLDQILALVATVIGITYGIRPLLGREPRLKEPHEQRTPTPTEQAQEQPLAV